jgi:hypothetical protein
MDEEFETYEIAFLIDTRALYDVAVSDVDLVYLYQRYSMGYGCLWKAHNDRVIGHFIKWMNTSPLQELMEMNRARDKG